MTNEQFLERMSRLNVQEMTPAYAMGELAGLVEIAQGLYIAMPYQRDELERGVMEVCEACASGDHDSPIGPMEGCGCACCLSRLSLSRLSDGRGKGVSKV